MMINPTRFKDKVVLVTGAGSGIGSAVAERLAREGASLSLLDISKEGLNKTRERILKHVSDHQSCLHVTDVSSEVQIKHSINETYKKYGRIDGLYNNAGIVEEKLAPLSDYSSVELQKVLDVNLKGAFMVLKYTIPYFLKQNFGAVVNASSIAGIRAVPHESGYVASKHGVSGLTKAAALDCAKSGIRVNAIAPGAILTELIMASFEKLSSGAGWQAFGEAFVSNNPMKRFGQPEEVASLVAFLLSDEAAYVNGAIIPIDGGQSQRY